MKRFVLLTIGLLVLMLGAAVAVADDAAKASGAAKSTAAAATPAQAAAPAAEHRAFLPGDFKWVDAPAGLPKGS